MPGGLDSASVLERPSTLSRSSLSRRDPRESNSLSLSHHSYIASHAPSTHHDSPRVCRRTPPRDLAVTPQIARDLTIRHALSPSTTAGGGPSPSTELPSRRGPARVVLKDGDGTAWFARVVSAARLRLAELAPNVQQDDERDEEQAEHEHRGRPTAQRNGRAE